MEFGNNNAIVFEWNMNAIKMTKVTKQYGDVIYWCGQNNIQCEYGVNAKRFAAMDSTYYFIRFHNEEDAVAFKLRWL